MAKFKLQGSDVYQNTPWQKLLEIRGNDIYKNSPWQKVLEIRGDDIYQNSPWQKKCTIGEARREIDGSNMIDPRFIAAIWLAAVKEMKI